MEDRPLFNTARGPGSTLQLSPPFSFGDVSFCAFPLRASLPRLQKFCDEYLNDGQDLVEFKPYLPCVFLILLDYGEMAADLANAGWVSQREVAFTVPLRWHTVECEERRFHDWASTCPFIYVDNVLSMSTGREVYGWPKVYSHFDPACADWLKDPNGGRNVFTVSTKVFSQAYEGEVASYRPFITVEHEPIPSFLDTPPNLQRLFDPWIRAPRLAMNAVRTGLELFQGALDIATMRTDGSGSVFALDPRRWLEQPGSTRGGGPMSWLRGLPDLATSLLPRLYGNMINLKQFRDASDPHRACFQAITSSKMYARDVTRCGPLGQQNLFLGNVDGGYRIDIHCYESQPLVKALGLEVAERRMDGGVPVASLRPVLPFWARMDLGYGRGHTVAWRSRGRSWRLGDAPGDPPGAKHLCGKQARREHVPRRSRAKAAERSAAPTCPRYNTTRGAAMQELRGPFKLPDTTVRVLPLLADEAKLGAFVREYLNVEGHARFEAWGSHVYLIAFNYSNAAGTESVGMFSGREVQFAIPVKWYANDGMDDDKLVNVGLVTPFCHVDDSLVSITRSEVGGAPTLRSDVRSPPDTWLDSAGPSPDVGKDVLDLFSIVLPVLGVGAQGRHDSVVQVTEAPVLPPDDHAGWRHVAQTWGPHLAEDLERKYAERGKKTHFDLARGLALELLAGEFAFNTLALKQFRDAWHPTKACYQSLVLGRKRITRLHELHEIEEPLHVRITRFPTQPISDLLGLVPKHTTVGREGEVEIFEPLRPLWVRVDLQEDVGVNVFERAGTERWEVVDQPEHLAVWRAVDAAYAARMANSWNLMKCDDARIAYEQLESDGWTRQSVAVKGTRTQGWETFKSDVERLERERKLRRLEVNWRDTLDQKESLTNVDEGGATDLRAYALGSKRREALVRVTAATQIRQCLESVSPATIMDSVLSRQWAKPRSTRVTLHHHKADYCIRTDSLGAEIGHEAFPPSERQFGFWPLATRQREVAESVQIALRAQLSTEIKELECAVEVDVKELRARGREALLPFLLIGKERLQAMLGEDASHPYWRQGRARVADLTKDELAKLVAEAQSSPRVDEADKIIHQMLSRRGKQGKAAEDRLQTSDRRWKELQKDTARFVEEANLILKRIVNGSRREFSQASRVWKAGGKLMAWKENWQFPESDEKAGETAWWRAALTALDNMVRAARSIGDAAPDRSPQLVRWQHIARDMQQEASDERPDERRRPDDIGSILRSRLQSSHAVGGR